MNRLLLHLDGCPHCRPSPQRQRAEAVAAEIEIVAGDVLECCVPPVGWEREGVLSICINDEPGPYTTLDGIEARLSDDLKHIACRLLEAAGRIAALKGGAK